MRTLFARPLPRLDLWLVGILLLALALRVWGLTWGLPSATHYFSYHPDESVVLETSSLTMNVFAGRLLPHFYHYGSLQFYLVCFANTLGALFGGVDIVPKDFAVWYPQWAKMYLIGRSLTVGMGVGTVWTVYAIGRRLWGRRAGLLAALTLAITPLHAQHSHFLTVDVPATLWAMLSLLWAVRLATGDSRLIRAAVWAGVFAGLAAATKYNLALMLLPLVAACVIRRPLVPNKGGAGSPIPAHKFATLPWRNCTRPEERDSHSDGRVRFFSGSPIIGGGAGLLAFVFAFFAACPGAILESQTFLHDLRFEAIHVQNPDDPTFRDTGNGFVYHITHNLDAGLGLPLLLLSLVSVGYALYRRERGDGLLAAFALPYYVLIGLAAVRYARYDIPLLPILALWNGRLLADGSRLRSPALRIGVRMAGTAVLFWTLGTALLLIHPMVDTDPRDAAYAQIQTNAPKAAIGFAAQPWFGSVPISPYFSLPKPGTWQAVTSPEIMQRIIYSGQDWDTDFLETKKPDIIVLSEFDYADALRLKDPAALHYFAVLKRDYKRGIILTDGNPALSTQYCLVDGMPTHDWPQDMLYTNPIITIYTRKTVSIP